MEWPSPQMLGVLSSFLASLVAAILSAINKRNISTLRVEVDGRLTKLLQSIGEASELRGHAAGVADERARKP